MGSKGWVVLALAVACLAAMAGPAQAAWGVPSLLPQTHSGPTDQSWLWREAYLKDPDGNLICLYHAGANRRFPPWRIA